MEVCESFVLASEDAIVLSSSFSEHGESAYIDAQGDTRKEEIQK